MDTFDLPPELYATPWLITLCARSTPLPLVWRLWGWLLGPAGSPPPHPGRLHALVASFFISHKGAVLAAAADASIELPRTVSALGFNGEAHVDAVLTAADALWDATPITVRALLGASVYGSGPPPRARTLARLDARVCLKISVAELLHDGRGGGGEGNDVPRPRYFVLDCRPRADVVSCGALPTSFAVDADVLFDAEALDDVLRGLEGLRGEPLAVMGSGRPSVWYHAPVTSEALAGGDLGGGDEDGEEAEDYDVADVTRQLSMLLVQKGFPRVVEVSGGFCALHQHQAMFLDTTLVGHAHATCTLCSPDSPPRLGKPTPPPILLSSLARHVGVDKDALARRVDAIAGWVSAGVAAVGAPPPPGGVLRSVSVPALPDSTAELVQLEAQCDVLASRPREVARGYVEGRVLPAKAAGVGV